MVVGSNVTFQQEGNLPEILVLAEGLFLFLSHKFSVLYHYSANASPVFVFCTRRLLEI